MNIRDHARTLAMASMVALALMSVPAGLVHAAPKTCTYGGRTYQPGDTIRIINLGTGLTTYYTCDGFTGTFIPAAPLPTTKFR